MRPIGAPRQGGHAGTQSALALLARSAALVLAVQQQRQHSSQLGSKRRRDEADETPPHPCKRQASKLAEPAANAASLITRIERLRRYLIAQEVSAALASLPPADMAQLQAARSFLASF
ncbi:hypothetical protein ABPG77_010251 [Micractinium sp. CCAP 211/92]